MRKQKETEKREQKEREEADRLQQEKEEKQTLEKVTEQLVDESRYGKLVHGEYLKKSSTGKSWTNVYSLCLKAFRSEPHLFL